MSRQKPRLTHDLVSFLREKEDYISGEKISSALGISRAAVWKKIVHLREKGFIIEAVPSRGYKLLNSPDLSKEEIIAGVKGTSWKDILLYDSVESTNDLGLALAIQRNIPSGTVIISDMQERGKGRLGRAWNSPPGLNIYMTIVLRPEMPPADSALLTILPALACASAMKVETSLEPEIKWPNDLLLSGKKVGGILTEIKTDPDKIQIAIIGIGINVNIREMDFPEELRPIATSLREAAGESFSRSGLIISVLKEFESWYSILREKGKERIIDEWRRRCVTLRKQVAVNTGREVLIGYAEDIDSDGMLMVLLPSGVRRRITAGDVSVLKQGLP